MLAVVSTIYDTSRAVRAAVKNNTVLLNHAYTHFVPGKNACKLDDLRSGGLPQLFYVRGGGRCRKGAEYVSDGRQSSTKQNEFTHARTRGPVRIARITWPFFFRIRPE